MKIPDKLIRVSRASIYEKRFDVTEDQILEQFKGEELDAAIALLPTTEEREFMAIYRSEMPELARLRRKISVCLDAEVTELSDDVVEYEYAAKKFRVSSPKNAFRICTVLDKGITEGFAELCAQGSVLVNGSPLTDIKKDASLGVDELQLLIKISSKFFFLTYLE